MGCSHGSSSRIELLLVMVGASREAAPRACEVALATRCQALFLILIPALVGAIIRAVKCTVHILLVVALRAVIAAPAGRASTCSVAANPVAIAVGGAGLLLTTSPKPSLLTQAQSVMAIAMHGTVMQTESLRAVLSRESGVALARLAMTTHTSA